MKTYEEKARSALDRIHAERRKRSGRRKIAAVCLVCLCAAAAAIVSANLPPAAPTVDPADASNPASAAAPVSSEENAPSAAETYAVYTDSIVLPEGESVVMADMMGCLVYQGKVYTQGEALRADEAGESRALLGEYLGEAKGTLSEWASQEDWATEFASTYAGPVYTVNGYDPSFRLCLVQQTAEEGETLQFLENLDGIGLNTGADLYDERLHLRDGTVRVLSLSHQDWNNGGYEKMCELSGLSAEQWEAFLSALRDAPFVKLTSKEHEGFYQSEPQGHLFLEQADGTTVELRLFAGGYVGYPKMSWIFVWMPGEAFDAVFEACR